MHVDDRAPQDSVEPGQEAVLVLELIDLAQRLDQALLEHVGGQIGVVLRLTRLETRVLDEDDISVSEPGCGRANGSWWTQKFGG